MTNDIGVGRAIFDAMRDGKKAERERILKIIHRYLEEHSTELVDCYDLLSAIIDDIEHSGETPT